MGLILKISLEERVGSFVVKNITGKWSGEYPYGLGLPTVIPLWVTSVRFYITPPGSPMSIVVDPGTEWANDESEFQVMPWDLGGREKIESGKWKVEAIIEGTDDKGKNFMYKTTDQEVFTKEVECCVDKMTAKTLNTPLNDVFRDEKSRCTAELSVLLLRAMKAKDCGNLDSSDRIITYIKLHCRCGC